MVSPPGTNRYKAQTVTSYGGVGVRVLVTLEVGSAHAGSGGGLAGTPSLFTCSGGELVGGWECLPCLSSLFRDGDSASSKLRMRRLYVFKTGLSWCVCCIICYYSRDVKSLAVIVSSESLQQQLGEIREHFFYFSLKTWLKRKIWNALVDIRQFPYHL